MGVLERCVACHSSGAAPYLPFGEPGRLARQLHAASYPRGSLMDEIRFRLSPQAGASRMPLDANTTESERTEVEAYFRSLFKLYEGPRRGREAP